MVMDVVQRHKVRQLPAHPLADAVQRHKVRQLPAHPLADWCDTQPRP